MQIVDERPRIVTGRLFIESIECTADGWADVTFDVAEDGNTFTARMKPNDVTSFPRFQARAFVAAGVWVAEPGHFARMVAHAIERGAAQ